MKKKEITMLLSSQKKDIFQKIDIIIFIYIYYRNPEDMSI